MRYARGSCREGTGTAAERSAREQAGRGEETARRCRDRGPAGTETQAKGWAAELLRTRVPLQGGAITCLSVAGTHDVRAGARC